MSKKYTFIDLFAGCGGLSEGFLSSGHFHGLAHVEWELPMVQTLRNRLVQKWDETEDEAKKKVILFDIQKTDELIYGKWSEEIQRLYSKDNHQDFVKGGLSKVVGNQSVDIIIGGPPCQAYSIAGRAQDPNSMKDDYRNYLFESYAKVVNWARPKLFVFENVPGILSACPGNIKVTERIYRAFSNIGYRILKPDEIKQTVFSAMDFNTPQDRKRVIIVGIRQDSNIKLEDFYLILHSLKQNSKPKTVRDAIGKYPKFKPLDQPMRIGNKNISHELIDKCDLTFHEARYHNLRDVNIFKEWLEKDMNKCSNSEKVEYYYKITGKKSVHIKYRNLEWDKPSPTIVSHLYKDGLMFIHPDISQARSITVREAASLQTFPEDFEFCASTAYAFKMIGNAVPVEFAKYIADAVYKTLER